MFEVAPEVRTRLLRRVAASPDELLAWARSTAERELPSHLPVTGIDLDDVTRGRLEASESVIAAQFIYSQGVRLSEWPDLATSLRTQGFRPVHVRPYRGGDQDDQDPIRAACNRKRMPINASASGMMLS